jgi:hypothetical protein
MITGPMLHGEVWLPHASQKWRSTRWPDVLIDRAKMTGALRTMTSASGRRDCGGRAGRPAGTSTHGRRRSSRNGG